MPYLLPYSYGFATRAPRPHDKLSFGLIFVLPIGFVCWSGQTVFEAFHGFARFTLLFLLGMTAQYSLYEIGYLQNDVYTARQERNPTIRLPRSQYAIVCDRAPALMAARLAVLITCLAALAAFGMTLRPFCCALILLSVCFALHNVVRGRENVATYLALCTMKYTCLPLLFLPAAAIPSAVATLFFAFVLPRSIEHTSKPKYAFPWQQALRHDRFRFFYYSFLLIIVFLLQIAKIATPTLWTITVGFWMYRAICFIAIPAFDKK